MPGNNIARYHHVNALDTRLENLNCKQSEVHSKSVRKTVQQGQTQGGSKCNNHQQRSVNGYTTSRSCYLMKTYPRRSKSRHPYQSVHIVRQMIKN